MSVLLEALKKAAEEKNKSSQREVETSNPVEETVTDSTLTLKPVEEETFQLEPSEVKAPSMEDSQESMETPKVSIKLSNDVDEPSKEKTPSIDDLELENQTSESPQEPDVEEAKIEPIILSNTSKEPFIKEAITPDNASPVEAVKGDEQPSQTTEADSKEAVEDSYEWSLGALPGYDGKPDDKNSEAPLDSKNDTPNPILTTNKRFRKKFRLSRIRQFVFGRSSNVAIYALFSILAISIVGFFSVYYFQQQEVELEQSMRKYKLVRTVLPSGLVENKGLPQEAALAKEFASTDKRSEQLPVDNNAEKRMTTEETHTPDNVAPTNSISDDEILEVLQPIAKPRTPLKVAKIKQPDADVTEKASSPSQGALIITKTSQESDIQQAYIALYSGDLNTAKSSFESVLSVDPNNLTALNGYAATQAQLGNDEKAIDNYKKVLNLDSNNLYAFEAMFSLLGENLEGAEWKQEIQRVLEIHSDSAVLNYALGNFYAQDSDWKKAQAYYFDAYALDNQNADYLVNLAVSLDQLGQYSLAEQYYTLALVHASKTSGFDQAQIKQRLLEIRKFMGANS